MKTFNLTFEGSLLDEDRKNLPTYSGVYLVYRGQLTPDGNSLRCSEIIYIGQAEDIRRRHSAHERRTDFLNSLPDNEVLFYSYAKAELGDLDRIENALIFHTQPSLNEIGKDSFLYPSTEIKSDGQCALLDKDIIVDGFQLRTGKLPQ